MNRSALLFTAVLLLAAAPAQSQQPAVPEDIQAAIRGKVDNGWAPSIVVGVVDSTGTRYFAYGRTAVTGGAPVDQRTVYEIGSITKVFTGIILADMAIRGEVGLDDPVQRYLPDGARVPQLGAQPITLKLLSAQHSGLPRMPNNFEPRDQSNPYADYDSTRLLAFLSGHTLTREPGARYEYSNVGVGLLGFALSRRDRTSYEAMVRRRVLEPLGMRSTMVTFTADAIARLARGSAFGREAANWDLDALAGAGALRSTAEDMTRFLAAAMGLTRTPLDSAFRVSTTPQSGEVSPGTRMGLGWHIRDRNGVTVIWHNGGTGGYRTWAGYDPARRMGVVVLSNSQENMDPLGLRMFDPNVPLPPVRPAPVTLSADTLDGYVGRYQLAPTFILTVSRAPDRQDRLRVEATGQGANPAFASKLDEFFFSVVDAQLMFTRDSSGRVNAVTLRQNGRDQRAERLP
jgi:serine-type D-Ala-D-Ala carboxypeptidase/endopeptidase